MAPTMPTGPDTGGLAMLATGRQAAQDERGRVDRAAEADRDRVEESVLGVLGGQSDEADAERALFGRFFGRRRVTTLSSVVPSGWRTVNVTCSPACSRRYPLWGMPAVPASVQSKTGKRWPLMAMIRSPDSS